MILKTIGLFKKLAPKAFKADDNKVDGGNDKADERIINLFLQNSTYVLNIGAIRESNFLIPNAKKAFNCLRQMLIKSPIIQHFDPKSHIWIKIDKSGYAIANILSQLNTNVISSGFS